MKHTFLGFGLAVILLTSFASASQDDFVTIPAASFEVDSADTLIPLTISVSEFMIARTELTQKQYQLIMGENPSFHKGDDLPVDSVTWWDAVRYCNFRSEKEGLDPCYDLVTGACNYSKNGYRLPTDVEWRIAGQDAIDTDFQKAPELANVGSQNTKSIPQLMTDLREKGSKPVGSYPPNKFGLYDMLGNVWEWCSDWFNPQKDYYVPLHNPHGPEWGLNRVLRGGGFITTMTNWAASTGYRFSREPYFKSRFTGFRLARSTPNRKLCVSYDQTWFKPYQDVPEGFAGATGALSELLVDDHGNKITSTQQWEKHKSWIRETWTQLLGTPPIPKPPVNTRLVKEYEEDFYRGELRYLQTEPDHWDKILVMIPRFPVRTPAPVVIVPFYDVDTSAAKNLGGCRTDPPGVKSYAYLMVQQGCIAVCAKYYEESYAERLDESVAILKLKYPNWTGLGKWIWDSQRILDYIDTLPYADNKNIGIIGHSLGGKMALYAAAFDERITAVVSSELGIGFSFSNYDDYWYFGDFLKNVDKARDNHELIAMIAPRPFLLIAGDKYDKNESWWYINAARNVYSLYGKENYVALYNHRTGHNPTPQSIRLSVDWLKRFLNPR